MSFFNDRNDDPSDSPGFQQDYRNGPTNRGTFIGTCSSCGTVWEFENYEVIPVPYPHGTCPNCHIWVAV